MRISRSSSLLLANSSPLPYRMKSLALFQSQSPEGPRGSRGAATRAGVNRQEYDREDWKLSLRSLCGRRHGINREREAFLGKVLIKRKRDPRSNLAHHRKTG